MLPVLTRLLTPAEFGSAVLAQALATIAAITLGGGLAPAIMRRHFDGRGPGRTPDSRRLVASSVVIAASGTALLVLSVPVWGPHLAGERQSALWIGMLLAFPLAVIACSSALMRVQEQPWAFVTVVLVQSVGGQMLGVGAVLLFGETASVYLAGYLVGGLLAATLALGLSGGARVRPASLSVLRRSFEIGVPTIPVALAILALTLGDRVVIQSFEGSAAVARYQVAYVVGALGITLLSALQSAWLPITFAGSATDRWSTLARSTTVVTRLAVVAVTVLALSAPYALRILAPAAYAQADLIGVTVIVALAALPWAVYLPMAQVLLWEERTRPMLWIGPTSAAVNLVLAAVLLRDFGLEGVAAATLVALCLLSALCIRTVRRLIVFPWDVRGLAVSAGAGIMVAIAAVWLPSDGVVAAVTRGIGVAIGLWLGYRLLRREWHREGPVGPERIADATPVASSA